MKRIIIIVSLFCIVQSGCQKNESEFVVKPAIEFKNIFLEELRSITKIDSGGSGAGWGYIYNSDEKFIILDEDYDHFKTYELGLTAFSKWKSSTNIRTSSAGGGGSQFNMSFGNYPHHAFVDVISYKLHDNNMIEIRIHAVVSEEEVLTLDKLMKQQYK